MKTLQISEETWEKIKDQLQEEEKIEFNGIKSLEGKNVFFRTVTYHLVGKVIKCQGNIIQLEGASWVADSGRFSTAIEKGELDQVEYIGDWFVNLQATTDFGLWNHDLPKTS